MKTKIVLLLMLVSVLLCLVPVKASAAWVEFGLGSDTFSNPSKVTQTNPLPVALSSTASPALVVGTGLVSSTIASGTLASGTSVNVSALVTPAAFDIIEIQVKGAAFRGVATQTAIQLQTGGIAMSANDIFTYRYNGDDLSLVAAAAAPASFTIVVYKDR